MQLVKAEYPTPDHVLVHVSDPHFVAEGLLYGEMDPQLGLVEVLDSIEASGIGPEAIIFSGDLTDKGSAEAYRKLRTLGDAYAKRMGTQIIWAMGNHDERGNFRSVLLEEEPRPEPVDRRYDLGGLRVLVLDSSVPGHHHGGVTEEQLGWLADELQTTADDGTLLVIHHPPVPPVQDLAVLSELRDQEALAQVLEGSDVIGILSGHTHCTVFSTFAKIPVSVASATSYTQDLALSPAAMQGRDGARSFNLVRIHNRTFVTAVVPVGAYAAFGKRITAEETRRRLRAAVEMPETETKPTGGTLSGRR
ncbi:phosphodiesterase [Pseudarthrobacter sp. NamB4]|uniref:phosphodiesterase n=1 Tax=Pseudarthrobacter sp. NamB4 TaxID=2576837 RepID=UPI0010FEBCE0|nr:phosphodiesterase [Pseudarthrobacter sp. NamB4]TLM72918.1 phosphodiesterase [Pseudarthrobacter sp. NamB4]